MDISEEQHQQIEKIAEKYHLGMVLFFGSAVRARKHPRSDLDIAVRHKAKTLGLREYADLLHDIQRVFPEQEVDLSLINHADPLFLKKIMESCQMLYGDTGKLRELKIYAYKRYQDHRRFFVMERAYVDRFLKEMAAPK